MNWASRIDWDIVWVQEISKLDILIVADSTSYTAATMERNNERIEAETLSSRQFVRV